jgi:hypothetical protein
VFIATKLEIHIYSLRTSNSQASRSTIFSLHGIAHLETIPKNPPQFIIQLNNSATPLKVLRAPCTTVEMNFSFPRRNFSPLGWQEEKLFCCQARERAIAFAL